MSEFIAGDFIQSIFDDIPLFILESCDNSRFVEAMDSTGVHHQLIDTSLYKKINPGNIYLAIDTTGYKGFFNEKKILEIHDPEQKDPNKMMYVHVNGDEPDRYAHIHVYTKLPRTKNERLQGGVCISLTENTYFNHGKHQDKLTRDQFNALVGVLTFKGALAPDAKKNGSYRSLTWWKYMLITWNTENPKFKPYDTSITKIPPYDFDTLTQWEDRR